MRSNGIKKLIIGESGFIANKLMMRGGYAATSRDKKAGSLFLDITKPAKFDYTQINSDTFVVLLAAISSPDICSNRYDFAYNTNVTGTKALISNLILRGAKVLFFSSDVIYGDTVEPVDENSPINPLGKYAEMKAEVENAFKSEKLFKVFRLSYVLSSEDKYIRYLYQCLKSGEIAEVFHPFTRKVIYIADVLDAIESLSDNWDKFENQQFNICGKGDVSRKDIADYFNKAAGGCLKYEISEPSAEFWKARPKNINIKSMYLENLLGREPVRIKEAVSLIQGELA